jgi:hypothetical protein
MVTYARGTFIALDVTYNMYHSRLDICRVVSYHLIHPEGSPMRWSRVHRMEQRLTSRPFVDNMRSSIAFECRASLALPHGAFVMCPPHGPRGHSSAPKDCCGISSWRRNLLLSGAWIVTAGIVNLGLDKEARAGWDSY